MSKEEQALLLTVELWNCLVQMEIVQAISRDILADSMLRLRKAGYNIVLHVHDEAVVEIQNLGTQSKEEMDLQEIEIIMGMPIDWAEGLPLNAEGYLSEYYKKD